MNPIRMIKLWKNNQIASESYIETERFFYNGKLNWKVWLKTFWWFWCKTDDEIIRMCCMQCTMCHKPHVQIQHESCNQIETFLIGISLSLDYIRNEFCFRSRESLQKLKLKSIRTNGKIINNYISTVVTSHNISLVINRIGNESRRKLIHFTLEQ